MTSTLVNQTLTNIKLIPSQIQTLLSLEQDAKNAPSGDQAVHLTSFSWPSKLAITS